MTPRMRRGVAAVLALLVAMLSCDARAWAGGIWLYEMATPDHGTAAAGRAALGVDASTAWLNPAGMTRLDQSQLLLGAAPLVIQSVFDTGPGTTGVFVQVWIGVDDKLPRMARAVFRNDPLRRRHQVEFSDWKLGDSLPAGTLSSARATRAKPMPFSHPDPAPGPGAASTAAPQSAKAP